MEYHNRTELKHLYKIELISLIVEWQNRFRTLWIAAEPVEGCEELKLKVSELEAKVIELKGQIQLREERKR